MLPDAVKSIGEAFTSLFNFLKTGKEEQAGTEVIKDKRSAEKANNIAENIFRITDNYAEIFTQEEQERYERLRRQFDKKD